MADFAFTKPEDRLAYINEHRVAVGRRKLNTTSDKHLSKHEALIDKNAPYGNDPWHKDADK